MISARQALAALAIVGSVILLGRSAFSASDPAVGHSAGSERSGYVFAEPETRAMQDDDFSNPGFLWVDRGKALWSKVDGTANVSCESCHHDAASSMKGVGASYPKFVASVGRVIDLEQRINLERTERMGAAPYPWESQELLAMTVYVKLQSRGMPVDVVTTGPAHAAWLAGKTYYATRRWQLDMACDQCHVLNAARKLRTNTLSQGQTNGFPTYRLAWQTMGSVQRRFRECNSQIRAEPLPYGAQDYVNLELYVASLGQGLPVETPSVRQ